MKAGYLLAQAIPVIIGATTVAASVPAVDEPPPNVIIIFADDLGYGDLGTFGHPTIRTPHLDRLAAEGMKLTSFYVASSVCTPSRAGLLTGRLPIRSGMAGDEKDRVLYPLDEGGLPPEEITIAEVLKQRGYATACIGKWHLGDKPEYLPGNQGFDYYFGLPYSNDMNIEDGRPRRAASMNARADWRWWDVPLLRNQEIVERPANQDTLSRRYAEEAAGFIKTHKDQPFFLYLAHSMPHVPLFASDQFRDRSARGRYGDTVEEIDWGVGEIIRTLRAEGIAGRTLVVFTSDNGPWLRMQAAGGSAGPLRDGKGGAWEGGFRVPAIAWWPGRVPPASTCSGITSTLDLLPTLAALAGAPLPDDRPIDGLDLREVLLEGLPGPRQVFPFYRGNELYALRKGPWKAHFKTWNGYSSEAPQAHEPPLLFNLDEDPSESFNVASAHPDVVGDLAAEAERHLGQMVPGKPQFYTLSPCWSGRKHESPQN